MQAEARNRFDLLQEIRTGLDKSQFTAHFQAVVRLADHQVVGYEPLARWRHPTRGLLGPTDFLDAAGDSNLAVGIGAQVLESVYQQWQEHPSLDAQVSINVSRAELTQVGRVRAIGELLARHGASAGRVALEVPESVLATLPDSVRRELAQLSEVGIGLHADNFGSGLTSIPMLQQLPVTGIKLDPGYVTQLTPGPSPGNSVAGGLAGIARGLGLLAIAQGVATPEQAITLAGQGWTHAQGPLFGEPATLAELISRPRRASGS
jgi:EAL domain-containing protein (putative c-di-GMP-specific phosphodiesterase class I)